MPPPRLFSHLSDPLREALAATLALALQVIWSAVVVASGAWSGLVWTPPGLALARLLWHAAHTATRIYAELFRSAFDLHRFDVYESLHRLKPASPASEKSHGAALNLYLLQGVRAKELAYAAGGKGKYHGAG